MINRIMINRIMINRIMINRSSFSSRCCYSKENSQFENNIDNFKRRNEDKKKVKFLEEFGLLIKGVIETIQKEAKKTKGWIY